MNKDLLKYIISGFRHRKTRTFLTTLSVIIGIMSIFALVSFGQGLSRYVDTVAEDMGVDKIMVQQKGLSPIPDTYFTQEEVDFIKKIKGVESASAMMYESAKVQPDERTPPRYTMVAGLPTETKEQLIVEQILTVDIYKGRNLKKGDKLKVVLGYQYLEEGKFFDKPVEVGDKILINDVKVDVIGFYERIGNPNDDRMIAMTFDGIEELFGTKEQYQWIVVQAQEGFAPSDVADRIKEKFRRYRGEEKGKETFYAQTFEDYIKQFTNIINTLNAVLVIIALISVFISAINIMNTMYTSVLERTKDIGIMKAIGAKNRDIMWIFLIESGFLGVLGGVIGMGIGYVIAKTGGIIATNAGFAMLQPYVSPLLVIGCLLFSFIIGAVSGVAPAIQASKHKPVESLRDE